MQSAVPTAQVLRQIAKRHLNEKDFRSVNVHITANDGLAVVYLLGHLTRRLMDGQIGPRKYLEELTRLGFSDGQISKLTGESQLVCA